MLEEAANEAEGVFSSILFILCRLHLHANKKLLWIQLSDYNNHGESQGLQL